MMDRKPPKRLRGRNYDQSLLRKLKREQKITPQLEDLINGISLEDLVALKLEIAANFVGGKLFGFPIWNAANFMIKDALVKFALSSTTSHKEAANTLGITKHELRRHIKKYNVNDYLDN